MGTFSGGSNTTGSLNNFVGTSAGQANTTGFYNNFVGISAGQNNTTGTFNDFIGNGTGQANTTGHYNTMVGSNSGLANTTGRYNAFLGGAYSVQNTSSIYNVFVGMNAGYCNTTGSNNVLVGPNAGINADPAGNNNVYISHQEQSGDNGTIRLGDPSAQTSAYLAGVNGASTNSGVPVFIDSSGKLGTSGGAVNFSQVTGTLASLQIHRELDQPGDYFERFQHLRRKLYRQWVWTDRSKFGSSWPIVFKSATMQFKLV